MIVNCENSVDDIMQVFKILEDFAHKNKQRIKKRIGIKGGQF